MSRPAWFATLPAAWTSRPLGYSFDISLGKMVNAAKDAGEAAPYLAAGSIQPQGLILDTQKTMAFTEAELRQYDLRTGDIVVVEGGAGYGRSLLLKENLPGWGFQNHVARLRAAGAVEPAYAQYSIQACVTSGYIEASNRTATLPSLSREVLRSLALPHPPLSEQRAIAGFLDSETAQIDTLIAKQDQLIAILQERRSAEISAATEGAGPPIPLRPIVGRIRQGASPNCEKVPGDGVTEWAVLKTGCSNSGRFDPTDNKRLPEDEAPNPEHVVNSGDIVLSRSNTGALVGMAAVVKGFYPRLLLSDLNYAITLHGETDPDFVAYAMRSVQSRAILTASAKGTSSSMQKLSQRDVLNLEIALPSRDTQHRIVQQLDAKVSAIDTLITKAERFIELSKERRSALVTAAVTGQIDVAEQLAAS